MYFPMKKERGRYAQRREDWPKVSKTPREEKRDMHVTEHAYPPHKHGIQVLNGLPQLSIRDSSKLTATDQPVHA